MSTVSLQIDGMHCDACVRRVKMALEKTPGVKVDQVAVGAATVETEDTEAVIAALRKAGYAARTGA